MSSIQNPYYKISDLNVLNTSVNDTLFFQTEFKGGKNSEDDYTIKLYHTINERRESVIGMKHSTIYFKGNEWAFDQRSENQLRINRKLDSITIRPFTLHHKDESITFNGMASKHNNYKDLHLVFDKVDINKIIPAIDNLDLAGVLNGHLSLMQDRNKYTPEADLTLKSFMLNKYEMGDLQANISGNEDLYLLQDETGVPQWLG